MDFNFGGHDIPWLQIVKKIVNLKYYFLNFSIHTLCHLLESPNRGDFNGMPQYKVSCVVKNSQGSTFYLSLD